MANGAEKAGHSSLLGPPRQHSQGGGVGKQQQIGLHRVGKPADRRRIKGNPRFKGTGQFFRRDRDVFDGAAYVTENQTDKLHVVFPDKLEHVAYGLSLIHI